MDPKSELQALQAKTSAVVANVKAAGRHLTDAEADALQADSERIIELKGIIATADRNTALMAPFAEVHDEDADGNRTDVKGNEYLLNSHAQSDGVLGRKSASRMTQATAAPLAKALVAGGSVVTPVTLDENPIVLATPPANLGLLGVIPVIKRKSPDYSYVRQTVRTNNAAVVASGALKPVSVLTVETVPGKLQVVAHTSEYVDTYLLNDNPDITGFIASELYDGVLTKVTGLAVAAFAGTAGITTQAFSTNAMDSLYLGAGKAADLGYNPDVVLLSRATYDAIMLAKDTAGNYLYRTADDIRINGLYPVIATGLPANSAIILDSSKVAISTDTTGVITKWDPYTKLDYNQIRALVEGRFQFDVLAAPSIVKVALV